METIIIMAHWDEEYRRMQNEIPKNDDERNTLSALYEGKSLNECFERFWKPRGLSYEDLNDFIQKSTVWC